MPRRKSTTTSGPPSKKKENMSDQAPAARDSQQITSAANGSEDSSESSTGDITSSILDAISFSYPEPMEEYTAGGYHKVTIGDVMHSRYRIIRKLGCGKYSTVWMAHDSKNKRYVALKVTKSSDSFTRSSKNEIEFMLQIRDKEAEHSGSQYITRLLDDFTVEGENGTHIVMVFEVVGPNIDYILNCSNQMKMHVENIRKVCKQLLEAVDFLHTECGIVHCDLKLKNMMIMINETDIKRMDPRLNTNRVTRKESSLQSSNFDLSDPNCDITLKLGDFGISCYEGETLKRTVQTCTCRSPEAFLKANFGPPADIWSVACIAFKLLTGRNLFGCNSYDDCHLFHHFSQITELLGTIPVDLYRGPTNENHIENFFPNGKFEGWTFPPNRMSLTQVGLDFDLSREDASLFSNFLHSILKYDPSERPTAKEALKHPFLLPFGGQKNVKKGTKGSRSRQPVNPSLLEFTPTPDYNPPLNSYNFPPTSNNRSESETNSPANSPTSPQYDAETIIRYQSEPGLSLSEVLDLMRNQDQEAFVYLHILPESPQYSPVN